ncbi:MAG: hypothetical protein ACI8S6_005930 [Myxococcota bacterium]|jgi:hypothetical protein
MFPPLCCIGSRQLNAQVLQHALLGVLSQLGFLQQPGSGRSRAEGGMPAGMWNLGDRGAWIYIELLPFAHNAMPITELLALRLSASINLPLEVLLIDSLSGPIPPDADNDVQARVAYIRHRVYPTGQLQPLRHPIADRLVGESGYEGPAHEAPERILHAIIQSEGLRCDQHMTLHHRGTPRQIGLLMLLAETMGEPLRLRRRKAHFELEMSGDEGQTLVHFLEEEDIRFLQTVSPRFARLPLGSSR